MNDAQHEYQKAAGGKRRNSFARQAQADMAEARQVRAEQEAAQPVQAEAVETVAQRHERNRAARAERFDALQAGDSLDSFGLSATVRKKNAKSVITDSGSRWTRKELTG